MTLLQIIISTSAGRRDVKTLSKYLTAELIQMFDQCRAKTDFSILEHLACTQIRAVSQTRCKTKLSGLIETGEFWRNGEHSVRQTTLGPLLRAVLSSDVPVA